MLSLTMRIAAILVSLVATAGASPAPLKAVFARLAAREPLPQVCFAANVNRSLVACLGTTDGDGEALYFLHVYGETPGDGTMWQYFLQNDSAHPATVDQSHLDDAAKYLDAHGLRPATFDLTPLERRDGASAKVGAWTVRRVITSPTEEHLAVMCGTAERTVDSSMPLDVVLSSEDGPVDIALGSLTRDQVLVVTTAHNPHTINREAARFDASAVCHSK